ncbi:hypothetical protein ACFFRR_006094 [Megaselia abdita]
MAKLSWLLIIIVIECVVSVEYQYDDLLRNFTEYRSRQKRTLTFLGGGTNKMLFSGVWPVEFEDPIRWRTLNCGYNLQCQYAVPVDALYPWDKFDDEHYVTRSLQSIREEFDKTGQARSDEARLFVYTGLETYIDRQGKSGRECLLKAICQNAQIDAHYGIFTEILNTILSPGTDPLFEVYYSAYRAGKAGVNCEQLFHQCRRGDSFLDHIIVDD